MMISFDQEKYIVSAFLLSQWQENVTFYSYFNFPVFKILNLGLMADTIWSAVGHKY